MKTLLSLALLPSCSAPPLLNFRASGPAPKVILTSYYWQSPPSRLRVTAASHFPAMSARPLLAASARQAQRASLPAARGGVFDGRPRPQRPDQSMTIGGNPVRLRCLIRALLSCAGQLSVGSQPTYYRQKLPGKKRRPDNGTRLFRLAVTRIRGNEIQNKRHRSFHVTPV